MLGRLAILCVVICCAQGNKTPTTKILGGSVAAIGDFPYFASLRISGLYRDFLKPICGGSIISHWVVLTAVHCMLYYPIDRMEVVVGTDHFWGGGLGYKVADYINHEQYNHTSLGNDICLLKVDRPIEFGDTVAKINLPTFNAPSGLDMVVAGLGYINNDEKNPKRLQKLTVTTLSVEDCRERLKEYENKNPITDKLLCTYKAVNQGICNGDSGSAVAYNGTVHGIASWAVICARGKPDVFTRVYKYLDWIDETLGKLPIAI